MAGNPQRMTVTVTTNRNFTTIQWRGVGVFKSLNLNATVGEVDNVPLITASTPTAYWRAILTEVLAALPPS